jgi:hypothetical protein
MPYFVVSNFSSGVDKRRSPETAASGSLRTLRNAFINEGGEIEKRKAFVRNVPLTAYGQIPEYKGRITGPYPCPSSRDAIFFRHRHNGLPGAPFVAGSGSVAQKVTDLDPVSGRVLQTFWVQKSEIDLPATQAMFHGLSGSEFSATFYVVEQHVEPVNLDRVRQHIKVTFTGNEPTSETEITANDNRGYQLVLQNKGYLIAGRTAYSSAVGDPGDMAGTGIWVNDLTTQGTPIGDTLSLGEYFGQLVIFGERGIMFWQVDPDPAQNQYLRSVPSSVFGPRSITGYGDGDILYLGRSGVRSLQARDSSNQARVSDVGSPIDLEIRNRIGTDDADTDALFGTTSPQIPNSLFYDFAPGIVHRDTGQFWLALRDKIYVLSRYPSAKVLAWSSYDLPAAEYTSDLSGDNKTDWVADWCAVNDNIVMRNFADEVYTYGGVTGYEYDDSEVEVILPFADMGRPGSHKNFNGIDIVCDGTWFIEYSTEFVGVERDIIWAPIAEITDGTRASQRIAMDATGTQIALRMTCKSSFAARMAEVMIHYIEGTQK